MFKKKNKNLLLLILLIGLVYFTFSLSINGNIFSKTKFAYYNLLAEAFSKGRLNAISSFTYDLSLFNDKLYLYWGPAPVLFISPFYLFARLGTSDVFYTLVAGVSNVVIFYFLAKEFLNYFRLKLSNRSLLIVVLSFALASPNFYLSLSGRIWHTSQIISIFYLLLCYLFYFKSLNREGGVLNFYLAVLFFNLAWLTRNTLIFNGLLFFYPLNVYYRRKSRKIFRRALTIFLFFNSFFLMVFCGYNYFRFGNPFDTGWQYALAGKRFEEFYRNRQLFSLANLPHNFSYYFLNYLPLSLEWPFIKINPEGNSVFSVYPILIFLFLFFKKKHYLKRKVKTFFPYSLLVLSINLFLLMLFFNTGWVQFGSRYFFDIIPLLFLLILIVIKDVPIVIQYLVLFYGVLVNFLGTNVFYQIKI